jgi:predicted unusual protein kinase regulating ubiquinone biosynthesis (AarF/ABC1/UbiB family)
MVRSRQRWAAGVRVAARRFMARARQVLTTDPGQAPDAGEVAGARATADEAGRLKAGMVKVAQITGYLGGAATDDRGQAALAALWDAVPPAPAEAIRQVVTEDLGAAPEEVFARFAGEPLASASLGQVHAAETTGGRALAVKVQYPEAAEALRGDLDSRGVTRQLAGADLGRHLDEQSLTSLRDAIARELDYRAEAEAMEQFRRAFAAETDLVIPAVWREGSSGRVLAMDRIEGLSIAEAATAEPAVRDAAGALILRFAWTGPLVHGLVHGDPNPGNYLVLPGDPVRVAFLDYGCTGALTEPARQAERTVWAALAAGDPFEAAERFRHALHQQGLVPDARVFYGQLYRDWERLITAPYLARAPFAFTADWATRLIEGTRLLARGGELRLPPELLLCWRQRLGVVAVLAMLSATIDARAILTDVLDRG